MRRLNGWQRIGVILSIGWVLWAFGNGIYEKGQQAKALADLTMSSCVAANDRSRNCAEEAVQTWARLNRIGPEGWQYFSLVAFVPLPFFWLAAYIVYWIGSWVVRGFRAPT